jgi:hypothetical protein
MGINMGYCKIHGQTDDDDRCDMCVLIYGAKANELFLKKRDEKKTGRTIRIKQHGMAVTARNCSSVRVAIRGLLSKQDHRHALVK